MRRLALSLGAGVAALFGVPLLLAGTLHATAWALSLPLSEDGRGAMVAIGVVFGFVGALVAGVATWEHLRR